MEDLVIVLLGVTWFLSVVLVGLVSYLMGRRYDGIVMYDGTNQHGKPPYSFECLRCGATLRIGLPVRVDHFAALEQTFGRLHRHCPEQEPAHA